MLNRNTSNVSVFVTFYKLESNLKAIIIENVAFLILGPVVTLNIIIMNNTIVRSIFNLWLSLQSLAFSIDAFVDSTMQIVCHFSVQIVKRHILGQIVHVSLHNLLLGQRMLLLELCCSCLNRVKLRVWLLFLWKEWKTAFIRRFAIHLLHVLDAVVNLLFCFGNIIRMQTHQIIVQSLDSSDKPRCLSLI